MTEPPSFTQQDESDPALAFVVQQFGVPPACLVATFVALLIVPSRSGFETVASHLTRFLEPVTTSPSETHETSSNTPIPFQSSNLPLSAFHLIRPPVAQQHRLRMP
jgi:hypothetical protein